MRVVLHELFISYLNGDRRSLVLPALDECTRENTKTEGQREQYYHHIQWLNTANELGVRENTLTSSVRENVESAEVPPSA